MGTTSSLRIDDGLYDSAKAAGSSSSRSAAQQIAHWAMIGREMELSHRVTAREIADVLAGRADYDDLTPHKQAVVRAEWTEQIESATASLDFEREFTAEGRSYVESDEHGNARWSNHR